MEYNKDGEEVEVGHEVDWDDCPEDYVPPYNSPDDFDDDGVDSRRRILQNEQSTTENPEARKGKFITLTKLELEEGEEDDVQIKPFDDGLFFRFEKLIKPKHISFYCKTDQVKMHEACDFRLFQLNKEKTYWEDNDYGYEQKEMIRS